MAMKKRIRPAAFGGASAEDRGASVPDVDSDLILTEPAPGEADASAGSLEAARTAIARSAARTPVRREEAYEDAAEDVRLPPAWPIYLTAFAVAVLWALAPIAFALGYRNAVAPLRDDTFAMLVFGLLAVGPALFVFFAAYMIRQGQKLGSEARRAKVMAEDMLAPALAAAARAGHVVQGVRDEIIRAGHAADEARDTLVALRESMASETERLIESTDRSIRTAYDLTTTLGRERQEIGALAAALDAQAHRVTDSINQQARMVSEATDLAETQLREAEGVLSARAADIAAAA